MSDLFLGWFLKCDFSDSKHFLSNHFWLLRDFGENLIWLNLVRHTFADSHFFLAGLGKFAEQFCNIWTLTKQLLTALMIIYFYRVQLLAGTLSLCASLCMSFCRWSLRFEVTGAGEEVSPPVPPVRRDAALPPPLCSSFRKHLISGCFLTNPDLPLFNLSGDVERWGEREREEGDHSLVLDCPLREGDGAKEWGGERGRGISFQQKNSPTHTHTVTHTVITHCAAPTLCQYGPICTTRPLTWTVLPARKQTYGQKGEKLEENEEEEDEEMIYEIREGEVEESEEKTEQY